MAFQNPASNRLVPFEVSAKRYFKKGSKIDPPAGFEMTSMEIE
jgi:hypothetical protein